MAKADARDRFPGELTRVYRCPHDSRWWHQTSQDTDQTVKQRTRIIYRKGPVHVTTDDAGQVARYVAQVVEGTGAGPTWGAVATVMGWPRWALEGVMSALARTGWLVFTTEARSLRPGPELSDEEE